MDVKASATLTLQCVVCGREFSIPKRTRPRRTCAHDCQMALIAKHANGRRNTSGRFEQEDFDGPMPGDPSVEQIWSMAAEIRKRNNAKMRLLG